MSRLTNAEISDRITELVEMLPELHDRAAHATSDGIRAGTGPTGYETAAMTAARIDMAAAYRNLADTITAYRSAVRQGIDLLEAS